MENNQTIAHTSLLPEAVTVDWGAFSGPHGMQNGFTNTQYFKNQDSKGMTYIHLPICSSIQLSYRLTEPVGHQCLPNDNLEPRHEDAASAIAISFGEDSKYQGIPANYF